MADLDYNRKTVLSIELTLVHIENN